VPRLTPPAIPAPIKALMTKDPQVKEFEVTNPSVYKPMSKKRLVNQMYRHYSKLKLKLSAPLSKEEILHLQNLCISKQDELVVTKLQKQNKQELNFIRESTGRYQGKWHSMTPRFIQRSYKRLYKSHYFPILSEREDKWVVESVPKAAHKYLDVRPKHMQGVTMEGGKEIGMVDADGAFIKAETRIKSEESEAKKIDI
jgi:hypothetical protein